MSEILSKEAILYEVYTALAKALNKKVEPVVCKEDEFKLIIDRRWRLHLDRDDLEQLHYNISSDGGAMRDMFDKMKNTKLEFISYAK